MAVANPITHKACRLCALVKPLSDFYVSRKERDGHVSRCKSCVSATQKKARIENPESVKARERRYRAKSESKEKKAEYRRAHLEEEHACYKERYRLHREKMLAQSKKYREENRERCIEIYKACYLANKDKFMARAVNWKRANPEKVSDGSRRYHIANPGVKARTKHKRRAMLAGGDRGEFTAKEISNLRTLQRNKCACCRRPLLKMHIDHVIPLSKGGRNDIANIQLLCPPCNLKKGAKDPVDFMQDQGFLL